MHIEGHNIGNIILGCTFSLFSGFLFTINRAINDLLDLNFVNTLLIVFVFRSLFFCIVIFHQNSSDNNSTRKCQNNEANQSWWVPIGDAHALIFSAPLPTMVLSKLIFGTRLKLYKFLCAISVVIGIICIAKPSYIFGNQESKPNLNMETGMGVDENYTGKDGMEDKLTNDGL